MFFFFKARQWGFLSDNFLNVHLPDNFQLFLSSPSD